MSKPFDATLNSLIDARPEDWVAFLAPRVGLTPGPAEVLDTDLSVTVQADKVFRERIFDATGWDDLLATP